jgi:hypothetical protein
MVLLVHFAPSIILVLFHCFFSQNAASPVPLPLPIPTDDYPRYNLADINIKAANRKKKGKAAQTPHDHYDRATALGFSSVRPSRKPSVDSLLGKTHREVVSSENASQQYLNIPQFQYSSRAPHHGEPWHHRSVPTSYDDSFEPLPLRNVNQYGYNEGQSFGDPFLDQVDPLGRDHIQSYNNTMEPSFETSAYTLSHPPQHTPRHLPSYQFQQKYPDSQIYSSAGLGHGVHDSTHFMSPSLNNTAMYDWAQQHDAMSDGASVHSDRHWEPHFTRQDSPSNLAIHQSPLHRQSGDTSYCSQLGYTPTPQREERYADLREYHSDGKSSLPYSLSCRLGHLTLDEMYEQLEEPYDSNEGVLIPQYDERNSSGSLSETRENNTGQMSSPTGVSPVKKRAPRVTTEYYKFLQKSYLLPRVLSILNEHTLNYSKDVIQRHCSKLMDEEIARQILSGDEDKIKKAKKALKLTYTSPWMEGFKNKARDKVLARMEKALKIQRRYICDALRLKQATVNQMKEIEAASDDDEIRDLSLKHFNLGLNVYDKVLSSISLAG